MKHVNRLPIAKSYIFKCYKWYKYPLVNYLTVQFNIVQYVFGTIVFSNGVWESSGYFQSTPLSFGWTLAPGLVCWLAQLPLGFAASKRLCREAQSRVLRCRRLLSVLYRKVCVRDFYQSLLLRADWLSSAYIQLLHNGPGMPKEPLVYCDCSSFCIDFLFKLDVM